MFKSGARYILPAWSLRTDFWLLQVVTMAMFWDGQLPQTLTPQNNADVVENKGAVVGRTGSLVLDSSLSVPTKAHTANVNTDKSRQSITNVNTSLESQTKHKARGRQVGMLRCGELTVAEFTWCMCRANNPPCWLPVSWTPIPVPPKKRSFSSMKSSIIVILHGNPQRS